jgi:hypothetical protein
VNDAAPVFELERFSAAPVSGDVAVVEVDGRFADGALNGEPPRLLIEGPSGQQLELPALAPVSGPQGRWHASFAVPADRLAGNAFALALSDLLLDLPEPDRGGADADRLVALSRELNGLRRELDSARERVGSAEARTEALAASATADKERALSLSAERMESALREARERQASEIKAAATARDAALAEVAAERERAEQAEGERDALADELRDARRAQKAGRADVEALRRERDTLARELEKALKVIPKGREEAREEAGSGLDIKHVPDQSEADAPAPGDDAATESVRVIGRQGPRRVAATAVLPPVDAELPPPPPILGWFVGAAIFVIFVVALTLLLI